MSIFFVLIITGVIVAPKGTRSAEADPMTTMKSVLKSWHTMYNTYREEVNLGYCWADYFFDIRRLLNTLSGPRILGINPDDPTPLVSLLRNWFDPEVKRSDLNVSSSTSTSTEVYQDYDSEEYDQQPSDQPYQRYIYPGSYEGSRSLAESRALSDLFISLLGLNVPPGYGPLMLGSKGPGPIVIIFSKVFGTLLKIGRNVLDTVEKTSILACTKDYILVKVFRWIDS